MNMMIVGSVVGNAPTSVGSSTHSVASSLTGSAAATVGQPPPAHLTHLTSAPVIGLSQQPNSSTGIPISLRTTVEHSNIGSSQPPELQHVHSGSPSSQHFSAVSSNVISHAALPSNCHGQTAYMYHGNNSQPQLQQVLTHLPSNSSSLSNNSSGNAGGHYSPTSGGATVSPYGHSLPPPCPRPTSCRPMQSSSTGRAITNGMQARSTPPSRPSNIAGRPYNSGASRSFPSSRVPPGGGPPGSSQSPAQHHMHLGSQPRELPYPPRPMPMSPQRSNARQPRSHSGSRSHGYNPNSGALPVLGPSQAHQILGSSINSPSLIPQHVPQGPYLSASLGIHLNAGPSSPQYRVGSPLPSNDNPIYPPHELKRITKSALGHDDEPEVHHETHHNTARKNLISPRNTQRRTFFNNAALQDHNYCAQPPPSPQPPRSPTPPLSPYVSVPAAIMGASAQSQPSSHEHHQVPHQQHESFSFGIAGYKESSAVLKEASAAAASSGLDKHPHHHSNHHHPSQSLPPVGYPGAAPAAPTPVMQGSKETGNSMVGGYPSPHYSGQTREVSSPLSRINKAIEDAGVGPMTPLRHEAGDKGTDADESPDSRPSPDRDGGEETETAPEEDASDDAITRCICDFLHDDGYMICCDKCSVWQHVVCMFVDKDNIPEEYLCEKCKPRNVDKKRAKGIQKAREKEIFKKLPVDSSDEDRGSKLIPVTGAKGRKTSGSAASSAKKPSFPIGSSLKKGGLVPPEKKAEKKLNKKPVKRRSMKDTLSGLKVDRKSSPRKNHRRKSASATDIETEEEPPTNDATALRSWIDRYEEAVTNHYSPELRARLQGVKIPSTQFKPKDINSHSARYNVSLRGNGVKVLTANSYIPANTPIIECSGKYMLANQLNSRAQNSEFVLFHRISSDLEVCVDCKTYGNDSRFCRRADSDIKFNAEVKHHLDKGSLHLYIVSTRTIDKNQEILLCPLERKVSLPPEPQLSIQDELRQIKKLNGVIDEKKPRKVSNAKQHRRLKREVKKEMCDSSSDEDMPVNVRKTRSKVEKQAPVASEKSVNFNLSSSASIKKEVKVETKEEKENKSLKLDDKRKVSSVQPESLEPKLEKVKEPLKIEIKEETYELEKDNKPFYQPESAPKTPSSSTPITVCTAEPSTPSGVYSSEAPMTPTGELAADIAAAKSPGKPVLGLPDQTGLIVGVNTINYDVSLRNKSMSREEKKMEMILKAIAAMEKAESRKKHESGSGGEPSSERAPAKRRRSNSSKKEHADSNMESSCDETGLDTRADRPRAPKGKRKRNISMRRRSRAKSGDSTSAMSADESGMTPNIEHESSGTPGDGAPFKFPFKKHQDGDDVDDDVSGHYIRGSRSPPGIANHLLRSAVTHTSAGIKSPTKSIGCSAKKRWLRAAMSEDHSEETSPGGGGVPGPLSSPAIVSGSSPALAATSPSQEPDYTPLKKRRLATYNESNEEKDRKLEMEPIQEKSSKEQVTEKIKSLPNGLKKRLISNLLLNAVLDKAMEDILPDVDTDGGGCSPVQQQQSSDEAVAAVPEPESIAASDEPAVLPQDAPSSTPSKKKTKNVRKGAKSKKTEESMEENGIVEEKPSSPQPIENLAQDKEVVEDDVLPDRTGDNKYESHNTNVVKEVTRSETEGRSNLDKARSAEEKPPTPIQHSVFKSFFSTDLSIDDIDRQIEAKRMELARENSLASSSPSPRPDFSDDLPRTLRAGGNTPNNKSVTNMTPTTARKKVSIADYKRRKQTSVHGENQTDSGSLVGSGINSLLSSKLNSLPPVTLPDLPGLEPASNKKQNTGPSVFEPKRTRSNSPLYEKRNSSDRKGLTPQESRMRSGSPLDKKSPAKGRDRTSSPRRGGGSNSYNKAKKQERWESKQVKERDSLKGKPSSPIHINKRVPVPPGVGAAVITDYPKAPPTAPRQVIHTPDMPREDLTERLRKEFGLTIEDSDGEEEDGSDSEGGGNGANSGGGNGSGGVGADYSSLRRHNGPERTNGWREEEKSVGSGAFWTQR